MQDKELEHKLRNEKEFFPYLRLLKKALPDYLVIITVSDTGAGPLFTAEHAKALMELGLKTDMLNRFRQPYIAIIDHGNVIYEKYSEDLSNPLIVKGKLNSHDLLVYSAGFYCNTQIGALARVLLDDVAYQPGMRGFNFFVYDKDKDTIIDTYGYDTFDERGNENPFKAYKYVERLVGISNRFLASGARLCTFSTPNFPLVGLGKFSEQERFIWEKGSRYEFCEIRDNKAILKDVWERKSFHYCYDFDSMEDLHDALSTPDSFINMRGIRQFSDQKTHVVNTRNGIRVTTDQPQNPKRAIFLLGICTIFGVGADDAHTIASFLQRTLNENKSDQGFIVYNYGYFIGGINAGIKDLLPILESLPVKEGDLVFLYLNCAIQGIPYCDLSLRSMRPHKYGDIFLDRGHYSKNGNHMMADGIYEFLQKNQFFDADTKADAEVSRPENRQGTSAQEREELVQYKQKLRTFYDQNLRPKIGSIVMNCNPFTLGHRYLVEQALKRCDHLIVFVVEEDKSVFPFADRIELVRKNLADLRRVSVIPSGQFIISTRTFKEYFNKESLQEHTIDTSLDVTTFAREIAPCLHITMRFAGEEPLDRVTRQYNESMARLLPQYGIQFLEIPRVKYKGVPISASEVRRLAKAKEFDKLKKLVPPPTLRYLRRKVPTR